MADYKIIEFNSQTAQIVVNFIPLNINLSIDLPIDANRNVPTGTELDAYIKGFLPYTLLTRQQQIGDGVANASEIAALIQG